MKNYRLGFLLLGVFTLVITIFVVSIGISGRQDIKTEKRANDIASVLNSYISKQSKLPDSLEAAGINDVPDTINFTKKGSQEYEFCVTYKTDVAENGGSLQNAITTAAMQKVSGSMMGNTSLNYPANPAVDNQVLLISSSHKKGKDCQTVKPSYTNMPVESGSPVVTPDTSSNSTGSSSSTVPTPPDVKGLYNEYCAPTSPYYQYTKDYCNGTTPNPMPSGTKMAQ
jgi:hypothetical protein